VEVDMQQKTSGRQFLKYGSVYDQALDAESLGLTCIEYTVGAKKIITKVHCFDCPVFIEMQSGMASLVIGEEPDAGALKIFAVHRQVQVKPGLYFSMVSVSSSISYRLIVDSGYNCVQEALDPPFVFQRILPHIHIKEILGYYYNIRNAGYHFVGERHGYFELTYVDRGRMETEIDGRRYVLGENDLILYGPGQFHRQEIPVGESCSYLTVVFDMEVAPGGDGGPGYEVILDKIFGYNKKIRALIRDFVDESNSQIPYMNSLMLCLLEEMVIRLLQWEFVGNEEEHPVKEVQQHYQDELLDKILVYIGETLRESITVAEICQKFSLSRSSLQLLFKENLQQTPKRYIMESKLEKAAGLIRENQYTISQIALMLGFHSIHYFSRAFANKYGMAPSEYAKQIFNN